MAQQEDIFKKLISHCKEYGFVFPSSDIYDGLGAVYDYGQYGVELKNNQIEEHTSELQSRQYLVCRLLLEKKNQEASCTR